MPLRTCIPVTINKPGNIVTVIKWKDPIRLWSQMAPNVSLIIHRTKFTVSMRLLRKLATLIIQSLNITAHWPAAGTKTLTFWYHNNSTLFPCARHPPFSSSRSQMTHITTTRNFHIIFHWSGLWTMMFYHSLVPFQCILNYLPFNFNSLFFINFFKRKISSRTFLCKFNETFSETNTNEKHNPICMRVKKRAKLLWQWMNDLIDCNDL